MSDDLKDEPLKAEARELFARVFRGSHHHGPLRDDRKTFKVHASFARGAATYDDDTLTRFVLICHEQGWRGAIRPGGPHGLVFMITKRARIEDRPDEEMSAVHPTLQQAVECLERGGHWGTYWRSRKEAPAATTPTVKKAEDSDDFIPLGLGAGEYLTRDMGF